MLREESIELISGSDDMICGDLDVLRLSLRPTERLMDHDLRVWESISLSFGSSCEDDRPHRGRHTDTDRDDIRLDELHRIIDRKTCGHMSSWRVDIESDIFLRICLLEVEELSDDSIRDGTIDRISEENNPIFEESRVDIIGSLLTTDLIDDRRDEIV